MDIDQRLVNWGRCLRDYPHIGHCFSVEHRFRPEPDPPMTIETAQIFYQRGLCSLDDVQRAYETRQKARGAPPDRKDGDCIEWAWSRVPSESCKALLKMFYVKRRQPGYIAKRLRIDFDRELMIAQAAIEIELARKTSNIEAFPSMLMRMAWSTVHSNLHGSLAGA